VPPLLLLVPPPLLLPLLVKLPLLPLPPVVLPHQWLVEKEKEKPLEKPHLEHAWLPPRPLLPPLLPLQLPVAPPPLPLPLKYL
jgi:hypothetical protein